MSEASSTTEKEAASGGQVDFNVCAKISGVNAQTATANADAGNMVLDANGNKKAKVNATVENGTFAGDVKAVAKGPTVLGDKEALKKANMAVAEGLELDNEERKQKLKQETKSKADKEAAPTKAFQYALAVFGVVGVVGVIWKTTQVLNNANYFKFNLQISDQNFNLQISDESTSATGSGSAHGGSHNTRVSSRDGSASAQSKTVINNEFKDCIISSRNDNSEHHASGYAPLVRSESGPATGEGGQDNKTTNSEQQSNTLNYMAAATALITAAGTFVKYWRR